MVFHCLKIERAEFKEVVGHGSLAVLLLTMAEETEIWNEWERRERDKGVKGI
jgi:hypothetical protein